MSEVIINTTNNTKFSIAKDVLQQYGVTPIQQKIETPEIQAESSKEICEFSAKYAYKITQKPVVVSDVTYNIVALNGFPGPFVKYINKWLSAEKLLALMESEDNREVEIIEFLSLAFSDKDIKTFPLPLKGTIATIIHDNSVGSSIDKILIRDGFSVPQNLSPQEELHKYYKQNLSNWHELAKFFDALNLKS